LQASVVALAALVGASRVAALLASYSAPLRIYSSLPSDPAAQQQSSNGTAHSLVCLGAEWHRFPSSFLLPGGNYRMRFVAAGFGGLLPVPFDASRGGTAAAPDGLNDRNARDERNELADDAACDFFVGVAPPLGDAPREEGEKGGEIGEWRERAALPFLDVNAPAVRALPAPARAFYLPRWFARGVLRRPSWAAEEGLLKERGRYVLMERRRKKNVEE
jgi:alpha-1,2-mannosyltransferase